jgi:hypothetical protein
MIGEPHAFLSHLVQEWSINILLAVTSKISIAQIICKNVNDVGFGNFLVRLFFSSATGRSYTNEREVKDGVAFHVIVLDETYFEA